MPSKVFMMLSNTEDCKWMIDSGYLFHVILSCLWLLEFRTLEGVSILCDDNKSYKIIKVWTIKFWLHGVERMLKKVSFVPNFYIPCCTWENEIYV